MILLDKEACRKGGLLYFLFMTSFIFQDILKTIIFVLN